MLTPRLPRSRARIDGSRLAALVGLGAAATATVVAGSFVGAGTALAAPQGRITTVTSDGAALNVIFSATGLSPGQSIDPASVKVSLAGTDIPSVAKAVGSAGTQAPVAVLTMDTSGSMQGAPLAAAKSAANTFLQSVPASTKVGLVTFSAKAGVKVPPTTDRAQVSNVINSLTASGDTALYDATVLATQVAGTRGPRTVLLFTDGTDTSSRTTLAQAAATVRRTGVVLDAVSLGTAANQVAALRTLAAAGKGQVIATADVNQLTDAFSAAARDVTNQVTILGKVPATLLGTNGNVTVTASAGGANVSDAAFVAVPSTAPEPTTDAADAGPVPVTVPSSPFTTPWVIAFAALLLFIGLAVLLTFAFRTATPSERREQKVTRKLSIYTLSGRGATPAEEAESRGETGVARTAVDFANRVAVSRDFESMLALRLERAAIPLKAGEWLLIHIGIALGAALLLLLLSGGGFVASMIGLAIGVVAPLMFLTWRAEQRKAAFLAQVPDTLQLMAGSLSSGYSLPQSVDAVVQDSSPPMNGEFNRALVEARLGVPIEDALDGIAGRMESVDFSWVVMAIRIQREVGGNLAEVLTTVAATMRERERLRRQVQVLSAEGRLSAWILAGLPLIFGLFLLLTRPEYLRPLYTTAFGWILLGLAAILMTVGVLWLRRAIKVEV